MSETVIIVASAVIITVLATALGIISLHVFRNKTKGKSKSNDAVADGVKQMQDLYTQMITDLKAENKSLKGAVNKYRGLYDQEEEDEQPQQDPMTTTLLQAAAQKYGIAPELLQTPEVQKFIKKNKDMLPIVLQFLAKSGNENQFPTV